MRRGLEMLRGAAVATVLVAPVAALPGSQLDGEGPGYERSEVDPEDGMVAARDALGQDHESGPGDIVWAGEFDGDGDPTGFGLDGGGRSGEPPPTAGTLVGSGIPAIALDAYGRAEASTALTHPGCGLAWSLVAAIGRVESDHGRHGGSQLDPDGTARPPIIGVPLNGDGVALIEDTDGGRLDGDPVYDRAVGPMQFIPTTWTMMQVDGNGDGLEDPHNIYDAALAAGHYLCSGDVDLGQPDQLRAAVYRYNRSDEYVDLVLSLAAAYERGGHDAPVEDPGPGITSQPADPGDGTPVEIPASVGVPPGIQEPPSEATGTTGSPTRDTPPGAPTPSGPSAPPPGAAAPSRPAPPPTTSPPTTSPPPGPSTTTSTTPPSTTTSVPSSTTTVPSTTTTSVPSTTVPDDPDEPVCPDGFVPLPVADPDTDGTADSNDGTAGEEDLICCAADEDGEPPASADENGATCCVAPNPGAPPAGAESTDDEPAITDCCTLADEDGTVPSTAEDGTPLCPELASAGHPADLGSRRVPLPEAGRQAGQAGAVR